MNTPQNEVKKINCEVCGNEFSCSAGSNRCWCFDVKIESAALLEIEKKYAECLCVNCLHEISAKFNGEGFTTGKTSL